jgi:hypothetical protein
MLFNSVEFIFGFFPVTKLLAYLRGALLEVGQRRVIPRPDCRFAGGRRGV